MGIFKKKKTAGITGAAIGFETIGRFRGLRTLFVFSPQDSVAAMRRFLTAKDIQHVHFAASSYIENQTGQLVILTLAGSGFPVTVDVILGSIEGFATLTPLLKFQRANSIRRRPAGRHQLFIFNLPAAGVRRYSMACAERQRLSACRSADGGIKKAN